MNSIPLPYVRNAVALASQATSLSPSFRRRERAFAVVEPAVARQTGDLHQFLTAFAGGLLFFSILIF